MACKENRPGAESISVNGRSDGHRAPPHLAPLRLPLAAGLRAVTVAAAAHFQFHQVDIMLCISQIILYIFTNLY